MNTLVTRFWEYFPIPEPHVIGLFIGIVLHRRWSWELTSQRTSVRTGGLILVGFGLTLLGWAIISVSENFGREDRTLVTAGPYSFSRHPMYLGWTVLYLGVTLLDNNRWAALLFPAVALGTELMVRREEQMIEAEFGDLFRQYRRSSRKYI